MTPQAHLGDALHAYLDNELGAEASLQARAHLAACPRCRQEYQAALAVRGVLQRTLGGPGASPAFLRRLRGAVRRADPAQGRRAAVRAGLQLAAAAALVVVAATLLHPPAGPDLTAEVVGAHLRSLQVDHLTDVASTDQHTVKPWFQGRVPFSPRVKDLAAEGFPLQGGRLDYLGGRPVAALVYLARAHVINVFTWPAEGAAEAPPALDTREGIHTLRWVHGGQVGWAASDVNEAELRRLAGLLTQEP